MNFEESVIDVLKKTFKMSQDEFENFKYLSLDTEQKQDCIYLEQQMYINQLKEVHICKERKMSKKSPLNWTSSQTRPNMSFGPCKVSVSVVDAKISDLAIVNKYIPKLE